MKTLMLLRHAKSSWDQPNLPDPLRPLAPRGRKAAPRMGAYMVRNGLVPDRALCSAALRAVETWRLVSEHLDDRIQVEIREDLYDASPGTLLTTLNALPDSEDSVLIIGHNPTLGELAVALAGTGRPDSLDALDRKFPTGALAVLDFSVGRWSEIREGTGHLRDFVRPKTLKP